MIIWRTTSYRGTWNNQHPGHLWYGMADYSKCSLLYLNEFLKSSEEGLGTWETPRVDALVLQSCVSAVMISSFVSRTGAFPLMHLYISVDKKLSLLISKVCHPKSFIKSAPLVLIKSKFPVIIRAALLWSLQIRSLVCSEHEPQTETA